MSHSINYQYIHFVWSTKDLLPLLLEDSKISLLAYLTGILKEIGGQLLASSSTFNHVHLLAHIPTNLSIVELIAPLKSSSSRWYRKKDCRHSAFNWNEGYSAFTISPTSIEKVKRYLADEVYRHEKKSFEVELAHFLKAHEIEFNPKFLPTTTYTKLVYHLVWSVKNRESVLEASLKTPLHACLQQEIEKNGCKLYAIGNVSDHIHLLVECSKKISTASLVQSLKTVTTHLIKSQNKKFSSFCWQEGYGVFSVGKPAVEIVSKYVNNQESHHNNSNNTFDQEWNWLRNM